MAKWVSRYLVKACSRVCVGSVPVFSRPGACDTQLFPFGIMDSANSGFRPLTFFFRFIAFFDPLIFSAFQAPPREYEGKYSILRLRTMVSGCFPLFTAFLSFAFPRFLVFRPLFLSLSLFVFFISFFSISLPPCADVFSGAAAAAAGRVSPPPPRRVVARWVRSGWKMFDL